jgi:glycosyltransferase involved in cell wall biosynthesis
VRISFLCNDVYTYSNTGWSPTDVRLSGTERGIVEWAEELASREHKVIVFLNPNQNTPPSHNGVVYASRVLYQGGGDVCINIKSPDVEPIEPTIFYTNDVDADKQDLSKYDAVIHISEWAKDNIPVNNDKVFVVPHGYDETKIYPDTKIPKQCIYTSSPDRGLNTLLRAWVEVAQVHPDATLKVTYGAEPMYIPNVEFLGELSEDEMNQLYRESDIWCHPASGGELQCIAGLKAQAAGCWPVIIPTMALSETVKYGTFSNEKDYAQSLIDALNGHKEMSYQGTTIKQSTDLLEKAIKSVVK